MEVKGDGYLVYYNEDIKSVELSGSIRLRGTVEYKGIYDLMTQCLDKVNDVLVLDLRDLQYLNSSGINTIGKFIIQARKLDKINLRILGNSEILWQKKTLSNLQRLWPKLSLELK